MDSNALNALSRDVVDAACEVHKVPGPGLPEFKSVEILHPVFSAAYPLP